MFRNNFQNSRPSQNRDQFMNRRSPGHPFMMRQQEQVKTTLPEKINSGVGGLSKVLTNVQQVMKVVDSAAPIVKEYGPIVKNIPNMYRLLKAFKNIESEPQGEVDVESKQNHEETISSESMVKLKSESNSHSSPRLYI